MSGPSENSPLVDLLIGYLTERVLLVGVDGTILSSLFTDYRSFKRNR